MLISIESIDTANKKHNTFLIFQYFLCREIRISYRNAKL